ncbi:Alpha/beta hydrolase fold-1 [Mycena albidolilacea]|uniref:Alpha/beta hydrolase fold-1 n=1 Tax=Mycena albidolilacea TaxID=1033008 RepID=A0AAD6YWZ7_9AGAR|nr:Alpha/beta hydrolase fold-1 [Mycena albidolilacea]
MPFHFYIAFGAFCNCSPVFVPVHVDVFVPTNPTDVFAGLKSNSSSFRRLLQLLVHGFTYTNQYWSPSVKEFQNYSYTAFSCDRGLSSLAIDWVGVGLSTRPANSSDVQYPTVAATLSRLAHHLKTMSLLPGVPPFRTIIGVGHSSGSGLLTFAAIVDGARSPFAAFILTSALTDAGAAPTASSPLIPSARDDIPLRWGGLDPGYITVPNRSIFYPPDSSAFSPRMQLFDAFTRDVGTVAMLAQTGVVSLVARNYAGRVAKVLGAADQFICVDDQCEDVAALSAAEGMLWPAAKSFELVVLQNSGHDLNLDFFAPAAFRTLVGFVEKFSH